MGEQARRERGGPEPQQRLSVDHRRAGREPGREIVRKVRQVAAAGQDRIVARLRGMSQRAGKRAKRSQSRLGQVVDAGQPRPVTADDHDGVTLPA